MSEDLASPAGGPGAAWHIAAAPAPAKARKSKKTKPADGQGAPKRGRPAIGEPRTIRFGQEEDRFATELGLQLLAQRGITPKEKDKRGYAEAVRQAVRTLMVLGRPLELSAKEIEALRTASPTAHIATMVEAALRDQSSVRALLALALGKDLMEFCSKLGSGDPMAGVLTAVRVAQRMGVPTVKRLDDDGSGHQ